MSLRIDCWWRRLVMMIEPGQWAVLPKGRTVRRVWALVVDPGTTTRTAL